MEARESLMMDTRDPVVQVLTAIAENSGRNVCTDLSNWHSQTECDCAVFSYKRDFSKLWGLDNGGIYGIIRGLAERKEKEYTLVVVWDGMTDEREGLIDLSRHVTPYEWAAALTLGLLQKNRSKTSSAPKLRFLILNLTFRKSGQGFIEGTLFGIQNIMPWLQDYRLVSQSQNRARDAIPQTHNKFALLRQALSPQDRDAGMLIDDIRCPERVLTTFGDDVDRSAPMEALKEAWRQYFLKPGDRHAIANIIGPIILANGLPNECRETCISSIHNQSFSLRAFRFLLEILGLLQIDSSSSKEKIRLESDGGIFGRRKDVRFLLVDDQFELGYQHIVAHLLFGNAYDPSKWQRSQYDVKNLAKLHCEKTIDLLNKALNSVNDWALPRMINICDILLLDLRLWDSDASKKSYFQSVVEIFEKLKAYDLNDANLEKAKTAASEIMQDRDGNEIYAITLLPLLISHYDPSLPIILFSSTHQREVIEFVRHRPNIITTFSKPLFTGYEEKQSSSKFIRDLVRAINSAMELHESRIIWERFLNVKWEGSPIFKAKNKDGEIVSYNDSNIKKEPNTKDGELKKVLSEQYWEYIVKQQYYDFASVPFEFIEGALTPRNAQKYGNTGFNLIDGDENDEQLRNRLGRSLQNIRNKKVHGHSKRPHESEHEHEKWRLISILQFLVYLDYIERCKSALKEELHVSYFSWFLRKLNIYGQGSPQALSASEKIPHVFYALYAIMYAAKTSIKQNKIAISDPTFKAINKLAEHFETSW